MVPPAGRSRSSSVLPEAGSPHQGGRIVNLRQDCVEIRRQPDAASRRYGNAAVAHRGDTIALAAIADVRVAADDLLPSRPQTAG
jgi:hypothetical protein